MLKCCRVVRAAWGANPADIKFQSISKREGDALLAAHRKKVEYKKPDEFAQKMALSVGAPDYPLNAGVSDGDLHTNPKTGEVCVS